MYDYSFMPCWKLDLLSEEIARQYMSSHIRLTPRNVRSKGKNVNLFASIKQYSFDFAA